jgi:hypothetical protein
MRGTRNGYRILVEKYLAKPRFVDRLTQRRSKHNDSSLIPKSRVLHEILLVAQLVKISHAFYGTRWFFAFFTRALHILLDQLNPVHKRTAYFNIIFTFTPRFSK